jgi:hypothetical protein
MLRRRSSRCRRRTSIPSIRSRPFGHVVEPRDEAHQDALARAGRPEDRDALARLDLEVDVPQHRVEPAVFEGDPLEADGALEAGPAHRVGRGADVDRGVEDLEDPAGADQRLLDRVDDRGDVVHLAGELVEEPREHDEARAERQAALDDEPAPVAEEHHRVDPRQEARRRREEAHPPEDVVLLGQDGAVEGLEPLAVLLLAPEALHDRDALDALGEVLHHPLDQRAVLGVLRLDLAREEGRQDPEDRGRREARHREARAQARHVDGVDRERDHHDDALDQHLVDEHPHRLHVARHPGDDRPGGVGVEEPEAEPLELVVDLRAQVDDQVLLDEDVHLTA